MEGQQPPTTALLPNAFTSVIVTPPQIVCITGPQDDPLDQNVKYTCTAAEGTLASLHGPAHTLTYSHTPERHHPRVPPPEQPLPVNDLHARSYVRTQRKRIEL